jgi:hypothetical protein
MRLPPLPPPRRRLQVWLGFSQALKPCQAGLTISIDAAFTAFTRGGMSLVELMAEMCNCSTNDLRDGLDFEHNRIGRLIRGIRVGTPGLGRRAPPPEGSRMLHAAWF